MKCLIVVAGFSMMALMAGCGGGEGSTSSQSPAALPPVVSPSPAPTPPVSTTPATPTNALVAIPIAERALLTAILNGDAVGQSALVSNNYRDTQGENKASFIAANIAVVKQLVADGFIRYQFIQVPTGAIVSNGGYGAVVVGATGIRLYLANGHSVTISFGGGDAWRYESDGVWRLTDSETLTSTLVTVQSVLHHRN